MSLKDSCALKIPKAFYSSIKKKQENEACEQDYLWVTKAQRNSSLDKLDKYRVF